MKINTVLTANNNDKNERKYKILDRIDGEEMIYQSADSMVNDVNVNSSMEFINQQQPSCMLPLMLR